MAGPHPGTRAWPVTAGRPGCVARQPPAGCRARSRRGRTLEGNILSSTEPLADPTALRELVAANRILAGEGVLDAFGHVSIRHPGNPTEYIISRSLSPELVTVPDLQRLTLEGTRLGGDARSSYAEIAIHVGVYEARSDVMAVCHNHSPSVIPFGVTGFPLRPIYHMASTMGLDVPVWDIAEEFGDTDMLVRTIAQGRSLARTLGPRRVALMRGHGNVVAGRSLPEVVFAAVYMERNAELQMRAAALGTVHYLSAGEVERAGKMLLSPLVMERVWTYWRTRHAPDG